MGVAVVMDIVMCVYGSCAQRRGVLPQATSPLLLAVPTQASTSRARRGRVMSSPSLLLLQLLQHTTTKVVMVVWAASLRSTSVTAAASSKAK